MCVWHLMFSEDQMVFPVKGCTVEELSQSSQRNMLWYVENVWRKNKN